MNSTKVPPVGNKNNNKSQLRQNGPVDLRTRSTVAGVVVLASTAISLSSAGAAVSKFQVPKMGT